MADKISFTLFMLNANKGFPRGVSQEGSAKRRDIIILGILKHFERQKPGAVLIQESTIQKGTARKRWKLSANYQHQQERKGLYQGIDITPDEIDEVYDIVEMDKIVSKDMHSLSDQKDSLVPEGETDHRLSVGYHTYVCMTGPTSLVP